VVLIVVVVHRGRKCSPSLMLDDTWSWWENDEKMYFQGDFIVVRENFV
jgi:hypothetical protein